MRAILSYLKGSWRTMCVIFALLIVQAYCDLTLPTYMSNIVDVGIQQNGVERAVPEQIRSQSMAELSLFLTDEEIGLVKTGYWEEDGVLTRKTYLDDAQMDALAEALSVPMVIVSQLAQAEDAPYSLDELWQAWELGVVDKEQLLALREQAAAQMGDLSGSTVEQMAIAYVQQEYEALWAS